jgi:hypothetical protein
VCYFLTIASPLTLSEIRSMLPAGLAAQPVGAGETAAYRLALPSVLPRDAVIRALERHRRGPGAPAPAGGWPRALAAFVAEHARNAGPTLFHLRFEPGPPSLGEVPRPTTRPLAEVRARSESWLEEGVPLLVVR